MPIPASRLPTTLRAALPVAALAVTVSPPWSPSTAAAKVPTDLAWAWSSGDGARAEALTITLHADELEALYSLEDRDARCAVDEEQRLTCPRDTRGLPWRLRAPKAFWLVDAAGQQQRPVERIATWSGASETHLAWLLGEVTSRRPDVAPGASSGGVTSPPKAEPQGARRPLPEGDETGSPRPGLASPEGQRPEGGVTPSAGPAGQTEAGPPQPGVAPPGGQRPQGDVTPSAGPAGQTEAGPPRPGVASPGGQRSEGDVTPSRDPETDSEGALLSLPGGFLAVPARSRGLTATARLRLPAPVPGWTPTREAALVKHVLRRLDLESRKRADPTRAEVVVGGGDFGRRRTALAVVVLATDSDTEFVSAVMTLGEADRPKDWIAEPRLGIARHRLKALVNVDGRGPDEIVIDEDHGAGFYRVLYVYEKVGGIRTWATRRLTGDTP